MTVCFLSDEGDIHVCGYCKQRFARLDKWLEHKQLQWCKAQPAASYHHSATALGGRVHSAPHQLHHEFVPASGSASSQTSPGGGGGSSSILHRPYQQQQQQQSPAADNNQPHGNYNIYEI